MSVKTKKQKKTKITWYQQNIFVLVLFLFLSVGALVGTLITVHTAPKDSAKAAGLGKALYGVAAGNAVQRLTPSQFAQQLDGYKALGVQWIRFDFDWVQIQSGGPTSYDWTNYDAAVAAANARGIKVLGTIGYTASWALPASCSDPYFCPPNNTSDYAAFAKAVATRYAPMGVHTWEIWNEPNAGNGQWLRFTLASYTALLKAAYPAIKQVDPTAFVLTGGTAPAGTGTYTFSPLDFLSGIYANGGKGYFDAVAHHPYCYSYTACPPKGVDGDAWQQMQDTNPSLRSIMIANGDQNKQIWATEFGAPTGGGTHDYNLPITEAQQAQMVTDAYTLFNTYTWAGPLFWYTYQDPCTTTTSIECYFGLVRADGSLKPAYSVYQNLATSAPITPTSTATPTVRTIVTSTSTPTPNPVGVIAQDTFARANQSHWGTASDGHVWSSDAATNAIFTITSNTGQVKSGSTAYNAIIGTSATNAQVFFSGYISSFSNANIGSVLRWKDTNNWYKAYIDGANLVIQKKVNGTTTTVKSVAFKAAAGTSYTIRFQVVGTTLSAKVWPSATAEPTAWTATGTDTTFASGYCGLRMQVASGITATYTSFVATAL